MDKKKKQLTLDDILIYGGMLLCTIGSFVLGGIKEKRDMEEAVAEEVHKQLNEPEQESKES